MAPSTRSGPAHRFRRWLRRSWSTPRAWPRPGHGGSEANPPRRPHAGTWLCTSAPATPAWFVGAVTPLPAAAEGHPGSPSSFVLVAGRQRPAIAEASTVAQL